MMQLEHAVTIQKPLAHIYALAKQVERYPEFLPGYLESRILQRRGNALLLDRAAILHGKLYRWKSWVFFEENRAIHFEHIEGRLRGMRVQWRFEPQSPLETCLTITHRFRIARPWLLGLALERWVFAPKINAIATEVVAALKFVCEKEEHMWAPV